MYKRQVVLISSKQGLSNKIKNFYLDQYINKLIDKNINLVLYLASIIITEKTMIIIIVEQLFNFIIDHSLADNTIARQTLSFGLPITSTIPFNKNNLVILNELKLFLKTLKYKSKFVNNTDSYQILIKKHRVFTLCLFI